MIQSMSLHIRISTFALCERVQSIGPWESSRWCYISLCPFPECGIPTFLPLDFEPNKLASQENSSDSNPPVADDHLLPAPAPSASDAVKLDVSQGVASLKYDALGPLVVNRDGVSARQRSSLIRIMITYY